MRYTVCFIATALLLAGCKEETDIPITKEEDLFKDINLSVSATKKLYEIGQVAEITIKASADVPEDLTVTIESGMPAAVISLSNYITIPKGSQLVNVKLSCLGIGSAKIKISSDLISNYDEQEITINVEETTPPLPPPVVIKRPDVGLLKANRAVGPGLNDYANLYYIKAVEHWGFVGTTEYSERNGAGYTFAGTGFRTLIIPYQGQLKGEILDFGGTFVGEVIEGQPYFKPVSEGTLIDANLDWVGAVDQGNYFTAPCVRNAANSSNLPDGEHFIVLFMAQEGPEKDYGLLPAVPAWLKIKVEGLKLTILDGAIRIADAETFKVGQKEL